MCFAFYQLLTNLNSLSSLSVLIVQKLSLTLICVSIGQRNRENNTILSSLVELISFSKLWQLMRPKNLQTGEVSYPYQLKARLEICVWVGGVV